MSKEAAKVKLLEILPHLRYSVAQAAKEGTAKLGILSEDEFGGGKIVSQFRAEEFLNDLAELLEAPPQNAEDDNSAAALQFFHKHNLENYETN
jgi:hypothetical protein